MGQIIITLQDTVQTFKFRPIQKRVAQFVENRVKGLLMTQQQLEEFDPTLMTGYAT